VLKEGSKVLNTLHAKSFFARTVESIEDIVNNAITSITGSKSKDETFHANRKQPQWSFTVGTRSCKFSHLSKQAGFSEYEFEYPRIAALY
jgi:hypothetical protein